jgi:proline dehydrogenase
VAHFFEQMVNARQLRRRLLYTVATSDRFEKAARALPTVERATYRRARHYIAGRELPDAIELVERLAADDIAASIDLFGEQVADEAEAMRAADAYVDLAQRLEDLPATTSLAIDLSHIGIDVSRDFCRRQLERICEALPAGRRLDVGAEDSSRTDAILGVVLALVRTGALVQMTVQANLRRSADDWQALSDAGAAIRLVKGAYVEPAAVAYRYGDETDLAFMRLAHRLHEAGADFSLATHDPVLREALLAAFGTAPVEMLLGVRADDVRALAARRVPLRLYVPFGDGWFRYWMRRVAEAQGA